VLVAALLAVGIGASYSNCFGIGFYFDDQYGIVNNAAIRSLWNIPSFFVDPYAVWSEATQVDMRPFLLITFALNYAISGVAPWSYHVLNLALHFTAALLVFVIVRDHLWWPLSARGPSGDARFPAAAAALFFALAPLNSQPVNYIWARSALLCVTLYLAAFLAFLRRRPTLGAALYALALFTKATAVTLPAILLMHDFVYRDRTRYRRLGEYVREWPRLVRLVFVPAVLAGAYVVYRSLVLPPWTAQARQSVGITPWIWFMSEWPALLYYVRLFVWPVGLSADHDFPYTTSLLATRAWLSLLALVAWITAALRLSRQQPQVTFATLWFFITLSPESSFAPLAEVVNEHRPYIASALGLSVLLAWLLDRGAALLRARYRQIVFAVATGLLCVAAVPVTRHRTWEWGDALRIWQATVEASPNNCRAWMNAGIALMARGDLVSARRYFERSRTLTPTYPYVYMNLSILDAYEGHLPEALQAAEEAVRLKPDLPRTHLYRGKALEKLGRLDEAADAYRRTLALDPRDTEAQAELARLERTPRGGPAALNEETLMREGLTALYTRHDPTSAVERFREVLQRNPSHYGATYQLATALDAAGKPAEARPLWETVLKMAEGYNDTATAGTARTRLQTPR